MTPGPDHELKLTEELNLPTLLLKDTLKQTENKQMTKNNYAGKKQKQR